MVTISEFRGCPMAKATTHGAGFKAGGRPVVERTAMADTIATSQKKGGCAGGTQTDLDRTLLLREDTGFLSYRWSRRPRCQDDVEGPGIFQASKQHRPQEERYQPATPGGGLSSRMTLRRPPRLCSPSMPYADIHLRLHCDQLGHCCRAPTHSRLPLMLKSSLMCYGSAEGGRHI
ncbi:hypothetical protein MRX96_032557 [Rhipicephalus microplus]